MGEKKNKAQKIAADAVANGQDAQAALKDFYKESGNKITAKEKKQMNNVLNSIEVKNDVPISKNVDGQQVSGTKTVVTCGKAKAVHKEFFYENSTQNLYSLYESTTDKLNFGRVLISKSVDTHTINALSDNGINWNVNEQFINSNYNYNMHTRSVTGSYTKNSNSWTSLGNGAFNYNAVNHNYITNSTKWRFSGIINRNGYYVDRSPTENKLDSADMKVEAMLETVLGKKLFNNNFTITNSGIKAKYVGNSSNKSENVNSTSKANDKKGKKINNKNTINIDGFFLKTPKGYRRSQGYTTFTQNGKKYAALLFNRDNSSNEGKKGSTKLCIYELSEDGKSAKLVDSQKLVGLGHGNTLAYLGMYEGEHKFATTQNFVQIDSKGKKHRTQTNNLLIISYNEQNGISKNFDTYEFPDNINASALNYKDGKLFAKKDGKILEYDVKFNKSGNFKFLKDKNGNTISTEYNVYKPNQLSKVLSKHLGKNIKENQILKNSGTSDGNYYYQAVTLTSGENYILTYNLEKEKLINVAPFEIPQDLINSGNYIAFEIEDIDATDENITANVLLKYGKNKYNYTKADSYVFRVDRNRLR